MAANVKSLLLATGFGLLMTACGAGSSVESTTTTLPATTTSSTTTTTTTIPVVLSLFSLTAPGLSVGDCFDEDSTAVQVDCTQLHDGQERAAAAWGQRGGGAGAEGGYDVEQTGADDW